eukprot:361767-Chlamydomonas_euryale.AAC.3
MRLHLLGETRTRKPWAGMRAPSASTHASHSLMRTCMHACMSASCIRDSAVPAVDRKRGGAARTRAAVARARKRTPRAILLHHRLPCVGSDRMSVTACSSWAPDCKRSLA